MENRAFQVLDETCVRYLSESNVSEFCIRFCSWLDTSALRCSCDQDHVTDDFTALELHINNLRVKFEIFILH